MQWYRFWILAIFILTLIWPPSKARLVHVMGSRDPNYRKVVMVCFSPFLRFCSITHIMDSPSLMEEPYQKNGVACRFPFFKLFFFLPPSHPSRGELKHKDLSLPLAEDPYQNNDVTCEMPVTDLVRGTVSRSLTCIYGVQWALIQGRLLSPSSGEAFWL